MAQALATCMSCNMRVPGVDGGGGGISQFWPQQACAVHLFVFMSLKNFLIDEHGWTSAFLSQTSFSKSLLTGNLCCSSLANYIIRVLLQKVWHCISQRVCPLNNIAVHLGFVSALFKHVV